MPVVVKEAATDLHRGPVLAAVEYTVIPEREAEFVEAIHQYARIRRRDGAYRWGIYRDTEVANRYSGDISREFVGGTSATTRATHPS
jgi:hypothetical protein